MKIHGHPWSINSRKSLLTLAEKGQEANLVLVMLPKGEQKSAAHVALHPFAKVPVLEDDGFVLYETRAIGRYLEQRFPNPRLVPTEARAAARVEQWINVADAYFSPYAHSVIVEVLFRRFLGGETSQETITKGREGMQLALDVIDRELASQPYLGGETFSLADIHWMPYFEYLAKIGEDAPVKQRRNVTAWWSRVSERPSWKKVASAGPQPYEPNVTADMVEKLYRR